MRKILLDHLFGQIAKCDAEVYPHPKMSSPGSHFFHWECFKDINGRSAFDTTHYFRWRDVRWSRDQNVNMVFAHNSPQHLNLIALTYLAQKIGNSQGKIAMKRLVTVLRYPHEVVLNLVLGVVAKSVFHARLVNPTAR